jgi:hypothetical protein
MPPRLGDPGSSPRFPERGAGSIKREKPIWTREQFGPWRCDVAVVPITGMRAGYPVFEVNVHWLQGPPLDRSLGPTPPRGMEARDQYVVDRQAPDMQLTAEEAEGLARELGKQAADILAAGVRPDLALMARQIRRRLRE